MSTRHTQLGILFGLILVVVFAASFWSYDQGVRLLRSTTDTQMTQSALNAQEIANRAIATMLETLESWTHQGVMVRILDNDPDHEITTLLEAARKRMPYLQEIVCLSANGKLLARAAQTNFSRIGRMTPIDELTSFPTNTRAIFNEDGTNVIVTVPINWTFDQTEFLGVIRVTLTPQVFLERNPTWWTCLASPSGRILAQTGSPSAHEAPPIDGEYNYDVFGSALFKHRAIHFPPNVVGPTWKVVIAEPSANFSAPIRALRRMLLTVTAGTALLVMCLISVFAWRQRLFIARLEAIAAKLKLEVSERQRAEAELQLAHDQLEERVLLRTAELQESNQQLKDQVAQRQAAEKKLKDTHAQLVKTSREAGMAEVATGVLHNVGNVLNSVNVSANLISRLARNSKLANLAKISDLLEANSHHLGQFITEDEKGKQVPAFLKFLAEHLLEEQTQLIRETEELQKNVDHIKQVVSMQQSYAKVSGALEQLNPEEIAEDALRICLLALERHQITIVREFTAVPVVWVDRHQALQILINLLNNAKQALDRRPDDRRLILRVRPSTVPGRACIDVVDNGAGIPAESLTRIFNHGFTTKKDGHGFGLHSGAIAAKQMGGSLTVQSPGLGHGATFTLELPARPVSLDSPDEPGPLPDIGNRSAA